MNLKQEQLLKILPKNDYNIEKAGLSVGYSPSYAKGLLYRTIRRYKLANEEDIRLEFIQELDKDIKRLKKEKDNSNYVRVKELKGKILGLQIDKSIVKQDTTLKIEEQKDLLQRFAIQ